MLTDLSVHNFTLVSSLEIELDAGMTAITGETGAGKSILLNALGLCLGDRADYGQIRNGEDRAEVSARFDLTASPSASHYLSEQALDDGNECLIRRVITAQGTSKAWINGRSVTLSTLRTIAQRMINIHSQHEHQRLTRKDQQLSILDEYAGTLADCNKVSSAYHAWLETQTELTEWENNRQQHQEKLDSLRFQVGELDTLALADGEYESLETEQQQLTHAEEILRGLQNLEDLLSENEQLNLLSASSRACQIAGDIAAPGPALIEAIEFLNNSHIQLTEARDSIRQALDATRVDPARLVDVNKRISDAFDLSRKHRVTPEQLPALHETLLAELNAIETTGEPSEALHKKVTQLRATYDNLAEALFVKRQASAKKLGKEVTQSFAELSMSGANLKIDLQKTDPSSQGGVSVEFLIRTNPGAPFKSLGRVASGGELSRISLAIQVSTASKSANATMVFDEVDVGIGGATAAVVGTMLRKLGGYAQVLCITHLAQVASQAHTQIGVEKHTKKDSAVTRLSKLSAEERIREIARMSGGATITEQSLAHAESLLQSAQ